MTQIAIITLLSALILSCTPADDLHTLSSSSERKHYEGEFEYILEDCEGQQSHMLNSYKRSGTLSIQVNRERIQFLRNNKDDHLNVSVRSTWNPDTHKLTSSHGQMGIADTEDWRSSSGTMQLLGRHISGQIINIHVTQSDNFCRVMFTFKGEATLDVNAV